MYSSIRLISSRLFWAFLLMIVSCPLLLAVDIPKEHIFVFERSTNGNYVCYDINIEGGKLNQSRPLNAYWVIGGGKRTESLTFLDRKMAFGVKVVSSSENEALVHLTAYKDLTIRICKRDGKWVGTVKWNGHEMILHKMFAQMGGSLGMKCEYVDVYGTDTATGAAHRERITP